MVKNPELSPYTSVVIESIAHSAAEVRMPAVVNLSYPLRSKGAFPLIKIRCPTRCVPTDGFHHCSWEENPNSGVHH